MFVLIKENLKYEHSTKTPLLKRNKLLLGVDKHECKLVSRLKQAILNFKFHLQ